MARKFTAWLIHKETALIISISFVVVSVFFMEWSVVKQQSATTSMLPGHLSASNFLSNLSQSLTSNLSIYLIVILTVRTYPIGLRYQSWFWLCLFVSSSSSVLGLGFFYAAPRASTIFFWSAAFTQVVVSVLLMTRTEALDVRRRNDVERHTD